MHRTFFKIAATSAALAVMIGAMGAHLLKTVLSPIALESVKTAAYYQMIHSLALIFVGILYRHYSNKKMMYAGYAFMVGTLFFSGSIYLMVIFNHLGIKWVRSMALITPVGGLLLITGWLLVSLAIPSKSVLTNKDE